MKLTADYHTHTVHSHGKGSVQDNVKEAINKGLTAVGITDHSVRHYLYGVKSRRFGYYISCIEKAKREYADKIDVKTGIELNLTGLDGSFDLPQGHEFDTVILGYHKAVRYNNFATAWSFFMGYKRPMAERTKSITKAYTAAIQKGGINIVAHPGYGVPIDYYLLGKACADYGVLFEINNKHTELTVQNIQEVMQTGADFVISSDAHTPQDVGQAYSAIKLAQDAGLKAGRIVNITEG